MSAIKSEFENEYYIVELKIMLGNVKFIKQIKT